MPLPIPIFGTLATTFGNMPPQRRGVAISGVLHFDIWVPLILSAIKDRELKPATKAWHTSTLFTSILFCSNAVSAIKTWVAFACFLVAKLSIATDTAY